jgi:16S rRNA G966 N2-methylase RsmD
MSFPLLNKSEFWTPANVVGAKVEQCLAFSTRYGALYEGDCLNILPFVNDCSIDTIFADPPFNLAKEYGR